MDVAHGKLLMFHLLLFVSHRNFHVGTFVPGLVWLVFLLETLKPRTFEFFELPGRLLLLLLKLLLTISLRFFFLHFDFLYSLLFSQVTLCRFQVLVSLSACKLTGYRFCFKRWKVPFRFHLTLYLLQAHLPPKFVLQLLGVVLLHTLLLDLVFNHQFHLLRELRLHLAKTEFFENGIRAANWGRNWHLTAGTNRVISFYLSWSHYWTMPWVNFEESLCSLKSRFLLVPVYFQIRA